MDLYSGGLIIGSLRENFLCIYFIYLFIYFFLGGGLFSGRLILYHFILFFVCVCVGGGGLLSEFCGSLLLVATVSL